MRGFLLAMGLAWCCLTVRGEERNLLQQALRQVDLANALAGGRSWVDFPAYADRAGWDALTAANRATLIADGERCLQHEWRVVKATDYLAFERSGDRSAMESVYDQNIRAIAGLLFAELAEGEGRFIDQLVNGVFHACEMTSWSLSAHLYIQRAKGSLPDHGDQAIDLLAAEMGSMLAWVHHFLHEGFDRINPLIARRIVDEVDRRVMSPYLLRDDYWWQGFPVNGRQRGVNNWNPWCNFNVLQCFLLLENDRARVCEAVGKTARSVDKFINHVKGDGACEEGPAYWGLAAGKLYDYLQLLDDATGGRVSVFGNPLIRRMGEYIAASYVGDGWVVNFADAGARINLDYRLIYRYGEAVGSGRMTALAAELRARAPVAVRSFRDVFRTLHNLRSDGTIGSPGAPVDRPAYTWYPETEFCYMRNGPLFFAAKGGHNGESHNHNDVGTFSLYVNERPVFIDVGVERYTGKTFGPDRYAIWTMQSDYHNLPNVNGYAEKEGAGFRSRNVRFDGKKQYFSLDIAGTFLPEGGVRRWERTYRLSDRKLSIDDAFALDDPHTPNQINFMVWGTVELDGPGWLTVASGQERVRLRYEREKFRARVERIAVNDARLANVWGDTLHRVVLEALHTQREGKYHFEIHLY